jgi:hypothetical protein
MTTPSYYRTRRDSLPPLVSPETQRSFWGRVDAQRLSGATAVPHGSRPLP